MDYIDESSYIPEEIDYSGLSLPEDDYYETKSTPKKEGSIWDKNDTWKESPRRFWGRFVMQLRQDNYMALHAACGEIRDLQFEGETLKAIVKEQYLYDILTKQENLQRILLELKKIDDKIKLEFVLQKTIESVSQKNIEILKKLFGDEITFL